jgi:DNA-binding winged helix-turn-helix (wHTH) protein/predicted ATPase/tetratricopeptide (TPR) repeat protein
VPTLFKEAGPSPDTAAIPPRPAWTHGPPLCCWIKTRPARAPLRFRYVSNPLFLPLDVMPQLVLPAAVVDLDRGVVDRSGQQERLTTTELDALRYLASASGAPVTRDELLRAAWGYDRPPATRAVDIVITRLRKKVEGDPKNPVSLLTVRNVGYRLVKASKPVDVATEGLIGRADDALDLAARLETARAVALVGPAGVGKTSLARAVFEASGPAAVWVEFAGVATPETALDRILSELRLSVTRGSVDELTAHAARSLGQRNVPLLVLDNAEDVASLLPDCVRRLSAPTRVLVTSRIELPTIAAFSLGPLAPVDASALFVRRAGLDATTPSIDALVARLDGLPLAVELAAGVAHTVGPRDLLELLSDRWDLLQGDLGGRWPGLGAALQSSWERATDDDQELLHRLTVFRAPFLLGDAVEVGEAPAVEVAAALDALARRSWIASEALPAGRVQFRLLESIREFVLWRRGGPHHSAARSLATAGVAAIARIDTPSAMDAYTDLERWQPSQRALAHDPNLPPATRVASTIAADQALVSLGRWRARWSLLDGLDVQPETQEMRLTLALRRFQVARLTGQGSAEPEDLERVLADWPPAVGPRLKARFHIERSRLLRRRSQLEDAQTAAEEGLQLVSRADHTTRLDALRTLSSIVRRSGDLDRAEDLLVEAAICARRIGNPRFLGRIQFGLGQIALHQRRFEEAQLLLDEARAFLVQARAELDVAQLDGTLLLLGCEGGDPVAAGPRYSGLPEVFERLGSPNNAAIAHANLGLAALLTRDAALARRSFASALGLARQSDATRVVVVTLERLAFAALLDGDPQRAREDLARASRIQEPVERTDGPNLHHAITSLAAALQGDAKAADAALAAMDPAAEDWSRALPRLGAQVARILGREVAEVSGLQARPVGSLERLVALLDALPAGVDR